MPESGKSLNEEVAEENHGWSQPEYSVPWARTEPGYLISHSEELTAWAIKHGAEVRK
jgi:hypothetical protein